MIHQFLIDFAWRLRYVRNMTLNETQRRYLADICGKSAEFMISIVLIGQMVRGRLTVLLFVGTVLFISSLVGAGTWLIGDGRTTREGPIQ